MAQMQGTTRVVAVLYYTGILRALSILEENARLIQNIATRKTELTFIVMILAASERLAMHVKPTFPIALAPPVWA